MQLKDNKIRQFFLFICAVKALFFVSLAGQTGLIQHLDANVEAGVIENGEGAVTTWVDQTSFANDAVPVEGSVYTVQENELTWLDFGTGRNVFELFSSEESEIWLNQSTDTTGFCVIISLKVFALLDSWNDIIGNSSAVSEGFGIRYSSSGRIQVYLGGKSISGAGVAAEDVLIMAFNYNAINSTLELWDSNSKTTNAVRVPKADFSLPNPYSSKIPLDFCNYN